VSRGSFP